MNPYARYQKQSVSTGTRIDALLSLFDAACERMEALIDALSTGQGDAAQLLRSRARLVVLSLWAGVHNDGSTTATNLIALYQFIAESLATGTVEQIRNALEILSTLREGFRGIREEATTLERNGTIPPLDSVYAVHAVG